MELFLTILSGAVGLAFYEGIRIYRCVTTGRSPLPNNQRGWYLVGMTLIFIATSFLVFYLAYDEFVEGVVLGFLSPNGIRAITGTRSNSIQSDDNWDNLTETQKAEKIRNRDKTINKLNLWFRDYFV